MMITENGLNFIKLAEGCQLNAYTDTAGIRTIGYGHAYWHGTNYISAQKAEELLRKDIVKCEEFVSKYDNVYHFKPHEFDALVSFAFNVGGISQLTADGKRNRKTISEKMLLYVNSGGKPVEGLKKRRQAENIMFVKGEYTHPYDGKIFYKNPGNNDYYLTALKVYKGVYGNGESRIKNIENLGMDYTKVQGYINEMDKLFKNNVIDDIISGKYGNNPERHVILEEAGFHPELAQWLVNYYYNHGKTFNL